MATTEQLAAQIFPQDNWHKTARATRELQKAKCE